MPNPWSATNTSSAGVAATVSVAAPASASAAGQVTRIRSISASLAGSGAGSDTLQIKDGSTVIWAQQFSIAANGADHFEADDLDIRGSLGNDLTIAFASGVASDVETINAQGDYVPQGYPAFQN